MVMMGTVPRCTSTLIIIIIMVLTLLIMVVIMLLTLVMAPRCTPSHLTRSAGHDDGQGDDSKKHWKCKPPLSVMQNQFIWSSRWQRRAIVLVVARVALNLVNWEAPQMGTSTLGVHTSGSGWWLYNEEAYLLCKMYLYKLQHGLCKICSAKV